jgi:hypothetical protein
MNQKKNQQKFVQFQGIVKLDFPHFDRHRYSLIKLNGGSPLEAGKCLV